MIAGMSKERLVRLAFTKDQADTLLHWEQPKEFEFQNQMYDVLEQQKQGDSVIYWCWWDQEETLLNRYLETLAKKAFAQDPEQQEAQDQLFEFLDTLFYHTQTDLSLFKITFLDVIAQSLKAEQATWYHSWKQRPPLPPPKLV